MLLSCCGQPGRYGIPEASSDLQILQVEYSGRPNDPRTYADLLTSTGLADIARYAEGMGPNKNLIVP